MSAENFANIIIEKLNNSIGTDGSKYSSDTPSKANQAIADGITEYIINNTKIQINYTGMIPGTPSVPDPIVSDTCEVTGKCSPPTGIDFDSWIKSIELNIISGFKIGKGLAGITPVSPPPAFISGLKISQNDIKSVHTNNLNNPQKPVWTFIANSILIWLNSIVGVSYGATNINSGSTGTSTPIKITIT